MGVLIDAVMSMARAARFRSVRAVLPPDTWFELPGRLRFGMPWPWQQHTEVDAEIVDDTGQAGARVPLGQASAPRTSGEAGVLLWRGDGSLEPYLTDLAGYCRQVYGGPPRSLRWIRLGGVRAVVIEADTANAQRTHRLVAEWGLNHTLHGEFRTPADAADGYRPHLDTMLATWQWA
ncbi:hypothetical protein [Virgisporangium aurantiacum]|uniref:Uncharacterized protein n=1 Tax=Virgisporangium aurantiacum TaxID=175570 RepID=A0A8J3ZLD5_9ACTN|nr:hypothetical protein [Virgisporangium aurantiacum]GIJ63545.1 hypothetical protein Vau01_110610 [Virgisporangium aurantiacum]